jgi:hypothetical protein
VLEYLDAVGTVFLFTNNGLVSSTTIWENSLALDGCGGGGGGGREKDDAGRLMIGLATNAFRLGFFSLSFWATYNNEILNNVNIDNCCCCCYRWFFRF